MIDIIIVSLLDLDIRTTMRLLVIGNLITTFVLMAYKHREGEIKSLNIYSLGKIVQSAGWLLISLRGEISLQLSGYLANFLLLAGFALEMTAFSRLNKRRPCLELVFVFFVVCGSVSLLLFPDKSLWVVFISLSIVGIYAPTAIILFSFPGASKLQKVVSILFLLFCSILALRSYAAIEHGIVLFSVTLIQSLTFVALFGFALVGGIGFLLLMNEGLENKLHIAATTDPLTGVLNRRSFMDSASQCLDVALRNKKSVALLMIDIDNFKSINDNFGHSAGDIVLQEFSRIVGGNLRPNDVFGRIGGEEFAILIAASDEVAFGIAERIRGCVESHVVDSAGGLSYTVSIGVDACNPGHMSSLNALLHRSDMALYQAKNSGRNQVCFAKDMGSNLLGAQEQF